MGNQLSKINNDQAWYAPRHFVIHQEKGQKQLLEQYGIEYELAPVLCVRTNMGYSVVAEFIMQEESGEKIAEALNVIKQQLESFFFMTDYSEAELLAIQQVFPSAKSFICAFHREQAWEWWERDHKHGLTKQRQHKLEQTALLEHWDTYQSWIWLADHCCILIAVISDTFNLSSVCFLEDNVMKLKQQQSSWFKSSE